MANTQRPRLNGQKVRELKIQEIYCLICAQLAKKAAINGDDPPNEGRVGIAITWMVAQFPGGFVGSYPVCLEHLDVTEPATRLVTG